MIYLSSLELDPSDRDVRQLLANPYRVHQKLLHAWPDGAVGRMLYRLEWERRPLRVLVQSAQEADWSRCFPRGTGLSEPPRQKAVEFRPMRGQLLRFLLRANPTVRRLRAQGPGPAAHDPLIGKRVALYREPEQLAWLVRKGEQYGFEVPLLGRDEAGEPVYDVEVRDRGDVVGFKSGGGRLVHHCVDFEGRLRVTDTEAFSAAVEAGIGSAKGFGFGLLSVAPAG